MINGRLNLILRQENMNDVFQALMGALGTIIQHKGGERSPLEWGNLYEQSVETFLNARSAHRLSWATPPPAIGGYERVQKLTSAIVGSFQSLSANDAIMSLAELTADWMCTVPEELILDFAKYTGAKLGQEEISETDLMNFMQKCLSMALEVGR